MMQQQQQQKQISEVTRAVELRVHRAAEARTDDIAWLSSFLGFSSSLHLRLHLIMVALPQECTGSSQHQDHRGEEEPGEVITVVNDD